MTSQNASIRSFITDKHGKVVLWQSPNPPLILWAVTTVLSKLVKAGSLHNLFSTLAFGAIFTWAWLEIFQGASPFRRVLGVVVIILSIRSHL